MLRHPTLASLVLTAAAVASAADPDVETTSRAANIEGTLGLSVGGAWVDGDHTAFQRQFQHNTDLFGGIEQLRYRREADTSAFRLDAKLIPGDETYGLHGNWAQEERWYVDFGYEQFRTFYDGSGRWFPRNGAYFPAEREEQQVDRSRLWLELGFTPEDLPRLRLRYQRLTRDGSKPSTELGETNLTGGLGSKSIVPAYLELDETRDLFTVDLDRSSSKQSWAAGLRYEHAELKNARKNLRRPNEAAAQRRVTSTESVETDLFSTHGYYERRFGEKLLASTGALYTTLDTNLSGGRVYGAEYDAVFDPVFPRRQVGDVGFLSLGGGSQLKQYVFNGTLVYRPHKHWMIRPAVRYEHLALDTLSTFIATNVANNLSTTLTNSSADTDKQENKLTETVEVRYTGSTNWVFTTRGEWHQATGNLEEILRNTTTSASLIDRETDFERLSQKYTAAAQWYARPGLNFTAEYYYKLRLNDYDHRRDSTVAGTFDRYPAFIANQDFETHDFNVRASWRPLSALSLVTRYDLQRSTVMSSFEGLAKRQSAKATTHIVSQSATWSPLPRLYLLGAVNVAFDQLATPAAAHVRNSDNNYVNGSLAAGYALAKHTDLFLDASRYEARDYSDNSLVSLPYGADQRTDTISLTCVLRASDRLVYTVRYTFAENSDRASGGHNDYRAHLLYSKVQYSF